MSELEKLCQALNQIRQTILETAQQLALKKKDLETAAAGIHATLGADPKSSRTGAKAAQAFAMAAKACARALEHLQEAVNQAQAYIAANCGGSASHISTTELSPSGGAAASSIYDDGVGVIVDEGKWGYMFGRVTGDTHNTPRSAQNLAQLNRIGIYDTAEGRRILSDFFKEQVTLTSNIVNTFSNRYGDFQIRDGLLAGPRGFLRVESTWQVTDRGYRLATIIPRGRP